MAAAKAAALDAIEAPDIEYRCALRAWAAIGAVVRETLLRAGVDPASAAALRRAEAAAAELAAIPDTTELQFADNEFVGRLYPAETAPAADEFDAETCRLVRLYRGGEMPDPAKASLAELFAWSLARWAAWSPADEAGDQRGGD